MQCIFLWIRRLEQGCRPAYFENEIYNYSKRLYAANLRQWIGLLFITAFNGNTVCHVFIELSRLMTRMDGKLLVSLYRHPFYFLFLKSNLPLWNL